MNSFKKRRLITILLLCFLSDQLSADVVLVKESLRTPCINADCEIRGGEWTEMGWRVTGPDDRIKISLPETIQSGMAEIYITNFYPPLNGQQGTSSENYCVIFSGFDGPEFHHWTSGQSYFEIQSVWCDYDGEDENDCNHSFRERSLKLGVTGSDDNGSSTWISREFEWDKKESPDPVYLLHIEWDITGVSLTVTKVGTDEVGYAYRPWSFSDKSPYPKLRYFLVAQNDSPCDPILETIYSDVFIVKREVEISDGGTYLDTGDAQISDVNIKDDYQSQEDVFISDETSISDALFDDSILMNDTSTTIDDIITTTDVRNVDNISDLDQNLKDVISYDLGADGSKDNSSGCSCVLLISD